MGLPDSTSAPTGPADVELADKAGIEGVDQAEHHVRGLMKRAATWMGRPDRTSAPTGPADVELADAAGIEGVDQAELHMLRIIFDAVDTDRSGNIQLEEMESALHNLGDKRYAKTMVKRVTSFSDREDDAGADLANKEITFKEFALVMNTERKRSRIGNLALFILLFILPTLYSMSTRLTFIFLALEVTRPTFNGTDPSAYVPDTYGRGGTLLQVSLILGGYQTCRAAANGIIGASGVKDPFRIFFMPQVVLGAIGWIVSATVNHGGSPWYLYILCLVGLSETVVTIQVAALRETRNDSPAGGGKKSVQSSRLRWQYFSVSLGAGLAFIIGGEVYASYGFVNICYLGFGLNCANLVFGLLYYAIGASDTVMLDDEDKDDTLLSVSTMKAAVAQRLTVHTAGSKETSTKAPAAKLTVRAYKKGQDLGAAMLKSMSFKLAAVLALKDAAAGCGPYEADCDAILLTAGLNLEMTDALNQLATDLSSKSVGGEAKHVISKEPLHHLLEAFLPRSERGTAKQAELVNTLLFVLDPNRQFDDPDASIDVDEFVAYLIPRTFLKLHPNSSAASTHVFFYLKVVVVTQAVMALCIGTFLSSALLYYTEQFSFGSAQSGLVLGLGEFAAVLIMLATMTYEYVLEGWRRTAGLRTQFADDAFGQLLNPPTSLAAKRRQQTNASADGVGVALRGCSTIFTRPLHVPIIVLVVGLLTMGYTIPQLGVAIASQLIFSGLNDFSVSLLNELTASSMPPGSFQALQSFGQMLRRLGNCLTAFTGPILFGMMPQLPFLLYGGIVAAWSALILWPAIYLQAAAITKGQRVSADQGIGCFPPITIFRHFTLRRPWHVWEQEHNVASRIRSTNRGRNLEHTLARMQAALGRLEREKREFEVAAANMRIRSPSAM